MEMVYQRQSLKIQKVMKMSTFANNTNRFALQGHVFATDWLLAD